MDKYKPLYRENSSTLNEDGLDVMHRILEFISPFVKDLIQAEHFDPIHVRHLLSSEIEVACISARLRNLIRKSE